MNSKITVDVSIIVPNYNNGKYLEAFIKSALESTVLPKELIIIDDGSKDNSIEVIESYKVLNFLIPIFFDENKGLTTALNKGLEIATGKYIMRADPDDILIPERIEKQFQFMEINTEIDVLGCNVTYFNDKNGEKINNSNFPVNHKQIEIEYRSGKHGIQHPTAFIRGEIYKKYRYQKTFPGEDYEIFARMIKDGFKFSNLTESLYFMRIHSGSSTSNIKYGDIIQTFNFRDEIFNTKTSKTYIYTYYQYIKHYRYYQLKKNKIARYFHLLISILFQPKKLIKRVFKIHFK